MLVDEFPAFAMVPQQVEHPVALLPCHIEDLHGHQPIDVNRLAACLFMAAEHRMHTLAECLGSFVVAARGGAVMVMMQRLTAIEPRANRRIEGVVGGGAA